MWSVVAVDVAQTVRCLIVATKQTALLQKKMMIHLTRKMFSPKALSAAGHSAIRLYCDHYDLDNLLAMQHCHTCILFGNIEHYVPVDHNYCMLVTFFLWSPSVGCCLLEPVHPQIALPYPSLYMRSWLSRV